MSAPQEMLTSVAVMVRARSEATNAATLPTSASVAVRFSRAACWIPRDDLVALWKVLRQGLGDPRRFQGDDANTILAELAGPLAAKTLDGVEGDFEAAQPGERLRAVAAKCQDHSRPARDHMPDGRARRQKMRAHGNRDRLEEILHRYPGQRLLAMSP